MEEKINENIVEETEAVLDSDKVIELISKCKFSDSEIVNGLPTKEFTYVQGIANEYFLNTARLNENKREIAKLVDMLPIVPLIPQSFLSLCVDKNGRQWTGDQGVMELLLIMGIACDLIEYAAPKEEWSKYVGSVPIVVRSLKDPNAKVVGEPPENFKNYLTEEEIQKIADKQQQREEEKKRQEEIKAKQQKLAKEIFEKNYQKAQPIFTLLGYKIVLKDDKYILQDSKGEDICEMTITPVMDGFTYAGVVNDTSIEYTHIVDGTNSDGGLIYRDIITSSNLKLQDKPYDGKLVRVELGNGQHEVSNVPRFEATIIDPNSNEKTTNYRMDPYGMSISIENNFGPYGNYEDGTARKVHYIDASTTPFVNQGPLMLHELQENGNFYYIDIDRENKYPEYPAIYSHSSRHSALTSEQRVYYDKIEGKYKAAEIAQEYLKTSRVKNLYKRILEHLEGEITGIKDYIHTNYPFVNDLEEIIEQPPKPEYESLTSSYAIEGANVECEKTSLGKKELKPKE